MFLFQNILKFMAYFHLAFLCFILRNTEKQKNTNNNNKYNATYYNGWKFFTFKLI